MEKHFIAATKDLADFDTSVPAPYLRKKFHLDAKPEQAEISICGLGFYALWINGREITKGPLAPYISNPDDLCYYDTYDLSALLTEGDNVIGILLGNGFMNPFGGGVWVFDHAPWKSAPCVALELSAQVGGTEMKLCADETFRTHPSPLLFDEIRMGEHYDARLEIDGWNLPDFDDSDWSPATVVTTPVRGALRPCTAEPIAVYDAVRPVSIQKIEEGYLYDFGINSAGVCRLSIKGEAGQCVKMKHYELLKDGKPFIDNIIFSGRHTPIYDRPEHVYVYAYTLRGNATETWMPRFSYMGFRYVLVTGITEEQATPELLTYLRMSTDLRPIADFSCSNERVNRLWDMVQNSIRSNFYYFPTDCPHREKNGWTGDASMSSDMTTLFYDTELSYRQWLENIRKAQNERGELPGIVPTGGWGFAWGNGPTWDSVLFNLPYMLYHYRGNTDVIRENAHAMLRYLEYVMTRRSEDGTIAIGLGDWVPTGKLKASAYDSPLALTDSITVMDIAGKAAEMFEAIGQTHSAAYAKAVYNDMRATIRRELLDTENATLAGNCQTSQALGLYYGVFEENERRPAFDKLVEFIHAKGDSFDCGFMGLHTIFHVLSDFGENELAYRMIMKPDYPSYSYLIDIGETAIPEWILSPADLATRASHNHHFLGDISRWFFTRLAGLCPMDDKTLALRLAPLREIEHAQATYEFPAGKASLVWKRNGTRIDMTVECPEGVTCVTDELPDCVDLHLTVI